MSDNKRNENNNNSLFLYTALIFIVAIIIIILAFFAQTHAENSKPKVSENPVTETSVPTGGPQGIAKSASELSQYNLELLEENRILNKELNDAENKINNYDLLLSANNYVSAENYDTALLIFNSINYENLTPDGKILYDSIKSKLQ